MRSDVADASGTPKVRRCRILSVYYNRVMIGLRPTRGASAHRERSPHDPRNGHYCRHNRYYSASVRVRAGCLENSFAMVVGASTHDPRITIRHSIDRSTCQGFNACHAGVHVQSHRERRVGRIHLDDAIGDVNKGGSHVDICNLKMNAEVVMFVITFMVSTPS